MLPVIALVGRPNVGKSTLFNRLTRTRDALVADFPGLTRDRKYGQANYDGFEFIVVDTGGIDGSEEGIETEMADQSLLAFEEADIVLFLVDARVGMTVADQAIANHLRKQEKKCFVVANKTDGIDADSNCAEFYQLSLGEVHHIAAAHGRGITLLLEQTLQPVIAELAALDEDVADDDEELIDLYQEGEEDDTDHQAFADKPVKLAIIGRPNVGKSTLTNRILGEDRVIVYDMPGTTRDSIYIPMTRNDKEYILIDTAGVRKRKKVSDVVEKFSVIKTLQAIEDCNVVLLVVDARDGISDQDLSLLGFALNSGRSLVIAVNKWDGLEADHKERVRVNLGRRLEFAPWVKIKFISALHGTGVGDLWGMVEQAWDSAFIKIGTNELTRMMEEITNGHPPPRNGRFRAKLRYAHLGGNNPPTLVLHGNRTEALPASYKKFLENRFRELLKLEGTPIRLEFKSGTNPYEGRKNVLTDRQVHKRKRMIKRMKK